MSHERWRKQMADENTRPHHPRTNHVNEIWYNDFIMAWGGLLICSVEFMGNRWSKAMTHMARACSSSGAKWNCQGDDGSNPWLEDLKGPSTTPQTTFGIYLFDTNLALNVTWGELSQQLSAASLLGRISYESWPSHLHPTLFTLSVPHCLRLRETLLGVFEQPLCLLCLAHCL